MSLHTGNKNPGRFFEEAKCRVQIIANAGGSTECPAAGRRDGDVRRASEQDGKLPAPGPVPCPREKPSHEEAALGTTLTLPSLRGGCGITDGTLSLPILIATCGPFVLIVAFTIVYHAVNDARRPFCRAGQHSVFTTTILGCSLPESARCRHRVSRRGLE